ncbi:N-acetylmuramoyl-L-alanine amidase family protein [Brevibacillus daliensis]|uniref:N-acetylmuramoyl-L-alanine amidase family protein n=1 Tax=Brevibacillus daliensis TaxID=2892995 RepID=UPI001E648CD4|nr:N-acetylmuramoyl-L-alanine amidase [Brevibacillus daliensis]
MNAVPLVVIDSGHGGTDPGAVGNGMQEKQLTLQISLYQKNRFEQLGIPVILTRETDRTLTPKERTSAVKSSGAKYCISNHINAGGGEGVEAIHSVFSSDLLAKVVVEAIAACGLKYRRAYSKKGNDGRDYFFMHRDTGSVETVIVEYGFIDHPRDAELLKKNGNVYAEAVVKAFCEFFKHSYTAPVAQVHWAKKENDELFQAGILKNDHSHELDQPITWGAALSLINRLRKGGKHS